jgi:hypothetical protein
VQHTCCRSWNARIVAGGGTAAVGDHRAQMADVLRDAAAERKARQRQSKCSR